MDRLQTIRVLMRVVDEGSFAAAARALEISPANVTRMISDLEEHLSVRLLQRTTRKLALTDAGNNYVQQMRGLLSDMDELEASLSHASKKVQGTLRIFAPTVLASQMLAPMIKPFREQYPDVYIDIHTEPQSELHAEEYDLSLYVGREDFNADVVAREMMTANLHLYASPAYLKRAPVLRKVDDLASHDLLKQHLQRGVSHWTLIPDATLQAKNKAKRDLIRITQRGAVVTNHIETILRMTLDGAGIGVFADILAVPYLESGELQRVLPQWQAGLITIYAVLPSRKFVPAHTRALINFMEKFPRPTSVVKP